MPFFQATPPEQLYRFDVNIPHVLAMRPPMRLCRGGGAGACGPRPCGDFSACGMFKSNWYYSLSSGSVKENVLP